MHGFTHHLPEVYTYAPMIVLTGWLVLFVERGALELSGKDGHLIEAAKKITDQPEEPLGLFAHLPHRFHRRPQ